MSKTYLKADVSTKGNVHIRTTANKYTCKVTLITSDDRVEKENINKKSKNKVGAKSFDYSLNIMPNAFNHLSCNGHLIHFTLSKIISAP